MRVYKIVCEKERGKYYSFISHVCEEKVFKKLQKKGVVREYVIGEATYPTSTAVKNKRYLTAFITKEEAKEYKKYITSTNSFFFKTSNLKIFCCEAEVIKNNVPLRFYFIDSLLTMVKWKNTHKPDANWPKGTIHCKRITLIKKVK